MLIAYVIVASKADIGVTESLQGLVSKKPHLSSVKGSKDKVRVTFHDVPDREVFFRVANQLNLTPVFKDVEHNQGKKRDEEDYRSEYGG